MVKVKVKAVKQQLADKNVTSMFNQMLGAEDADPAIVIPKYKLIMNKSQSLAKILSAATEDILRKTFPSESKGCDDIKNFVDSLNDINFIDIPEDNITPELSKKIREEYNKLKSNNNIRIIIMTCKNLIEYTGKFGIGKEFDDSFIARIPGFEFSPFPFSSLNIKQIWISPHVTDHIKKYIFTVMNIVLNISKVVYKTVTSPDVDVKEFSKAIIKSIALVKKKIPRCDKAFAKIEQSVSLLEGNFDGYYKDFIQSKNPSTIIESFVIDVSQSGGTDAQTTRQFRQIINYYQRATAGKIKDPKIKQVFDMLNSNFNAMEGNSNHSSEEAQPQGDKPLSRSAKKRLKKKKNKQVP